MHILITNNGVPIYEQIYNQIKGAILSGELRPDDALPSIRALAKDLRISVITTKRAYEELERDGFIYAMAAKGFYVAAQNTALIREAHLRELESHLRSVRELAAICGLSGDELREIWEIVRKENEL